MNILVASDNADGGGAENQMLEELSILSNYFHVSLATYAIPQKNTVNFLSNFNINYLGTVSDATLIERIRKNKFNLIHAHNIWSSEILFFLVKLKLSPIVMTIHDYRILCPTGWKVKPTETSECMQRGVEHCSLAGCFLKPHSTFTNASYDWFEKYNWLKNNINGWAVVNKHLLKRMKEDGFKNIHNIPFPQTNYPPFVNNPRLLRVGYGGLLSGHKGIFRLTKTVGKLSKINNKIEFIIIGNGSTLDYFNKQMSRFSNVSYKGFLDIYEIYNELSKCAVVYLPSKWLENFNLMGRHARLVGTPILVPNTGGFMQRLNKGISEFYDPLDDDNDALQLEEMLEKVMRLNSGSIEDRNDEIKQSNTDIFITAINKLYKSVI